MKRINARGIEVAFYEPSMQAGAFYGYKILRNLAAFKRECDGIIANCMTPDNDDVKDKVFTRDLFGSD